MIYLILAGVLFLGLLFLLCVGLSFTWGEAIQQFLFILLVLGGIIAITLLSRFGVMQLQGGMK
jgi:hypothetical protein